MTTFGETPTTQVEGQGEILSRSLEPAPRSEGRSGSAAVLFSFVFVQCDRYPGIQRRQRHAAGYARASELNRTHVALFRDQQPVNSRSRAFDLGGVSESLIWRFQVPFATKIFRSDLSERSRTRLLSRIHAAPCLW